jgi:hypothetical protein
MMKMGNLINTSGDLHQNCGLKENHAKITHATRIEFDFG